MTQARVLYVYPMKHIQAGERTTVFTSRLYQTNCTVIVSEEEIFVVDPNWLPDEVADIAAFVEDIRGSRRVYLIFTHADYDHIIGYRAFDGIRCIASSAFAHNTRRQEDVKQAVNFDLRHYIARPYPIEYPHIDIAVDHGQTLRFSDIELSFYMAPGHTQEGMFILAQPDGIWIAGDYLSDIEFPLVNGSWDDYRFTLGKAETILADHTVHAMIPGHGGIARSHDEIRKRRDQALEYLADVEALGAGAAFPVEKYRRRYLYWDGIQEWHQDNILRCQKTRGN